MKTILVIDNMPKSCNECILNIGGICGATNEPAYSMRCPLKPMPEKYFEREIKIETERDVEVCTHGITLGRNLLIEELEK